MARAYPRDLAALVAARWAEVAPAPLEGREALAAGRDAGPGLGALEELLDACYGASLMRGEERAVLQEGRSAQRGFPLAHVRHAPDGGHESVKVL